MPRVTGWSEDEFDDRAQDLAALIRRVWRAIARLIAAQAEQQSQVTMAAAKPIMPQWQQAVDGQIIGFVRNMYLDAAGTVSDALNAPDELLIGDDLVEVYTNAARNRLVGIGDDVWKNVQAQIALGNQSGESIPEIAARIRNVTGVSEGRSLTIARTEVHAAHEAGSYEQAVFVDPNAEKTWLATEDTRTRPSHRAVDGQTVKIGEAFNVGGSLVRYPGDPLGAPEDCINCRCSVAYNFDMITAVVDEPEPAMVAAGGQTWKPHNHPRGTDGKFIEKGAVSDFLKKAKPNIIDVTKAVGNLDAAQWGKLTDVQKTHIKESVDKLPKGTATHDGAKKTLDSVEKTAAATATAPAKPKTKIGETYAKLKDAQHGDVLATGTKYNSAGVAQKFKITADKSHVHPDYMPYGKMKLEFLKKNGEPGKSHSGDILSISQTLHPLPAKGKKPGKVEWDEPGTPQIDTPQAPAPTPTSVPDVVPQAPAGPAKVPAGLKGEPGGPAKITTGVVWAKHPAGTTIVESEDGQDQIVWNGKKYEFQTQDDIGDWATQFEMSKKDFYAQHKEDTGWKIPGGEKTPPPPFVPDADLLDQAYNPDGDDTPSQQLSPEAAGYDPTPDEVDWNIGQWERENAGQTTPEPPQTPSTPEPTATPAVTPGITEQQLGDLVTGMMDADTPGDWTALQQQFKQNLAENSDKPAWTVPQNFVYFTKVGGQAGSNPGGKYKAPDGAEWYIKKPKSKNHAANEQAAAAFYNLAGVDAPQVMKGKGAPELGGSLQTGTKIVPGAKANLGYKLNDKDYIKQIQSGFAMDAWLANWDVAGMGYDNVVEGADGKPHRIDVGGAMLYRAQGTPKDDEFGNTVGELDTLRNGTYPQSAAVFGSMTNDDIRKSAAKVEAITDEQIDQIVKDAGLDTSVAETLKARRKDILAKFPPISETDEVLNEVLGPPAPQVTPVHDIDAALGDLENGITLSVDETLGVLPALTKDEFDKLPQSAHEHIENTLEYALNNDLPGVDAANTAWLSLKNAPSAETAKAKLQKLYEKGLITHDEYVDAVGEAPPGSYSGVHDKGVLLNDLESGAILPMDQAIDLGIMLNESDYNDLSVSEKAQLSTSLSVAADMNMPGGKESYAHWQSLHNMPDESVAAPLTDEPDTSGPATSPGGALYYLDAGDQTKMVSSDSKFVLEQVNSPLGKYSLETKQDDGSSVFAYINDAEDVEYTTGQTASLWYPAKTSAAVDTSPAASGPMIDGSTLSLKALYRLIQDGKADKKYTDGQVIATSPNGTQQFVWRDDLNGYALRNTETGGEEFTSNLKTIQTIRKDAWHVPESNLPNHDGTLVKSVLEVPEPNDPVIDTETVGTTNSGALYALDNGDAEELVTLDGKWSLKKHSFSFGDSYVVGEKHDNGLTTTMLFTDHNELDGYTGLQVWYPKQEIDQSVNAPDATAGVSSTPVDLDIVQEKIDLGEYTAGEIIGITKDGQYKITYSPFLNGLIYQHKIGNTGDDDMDWDSLGTYDGSADTMDTPVSEFVDANPDVEFFEPQDPNTVTTDSDSVSNVNWDTLLKGPYTFNDVVAQTGDGKYQLVHKGMGSYQLYTKSDGGYSQSGGSYYHDDLTGGDLDIIPTGYRWKKVAPGTQFKSGKIPAKKMPAKKVAKAVKSAGVPKPGAYSPAVVTPGEKKFYLEDAEWGSLVAVEAVHLLNGAGGLDVHEAGNLTPTQTGSINTQLEKALNNNVAGAQAAWDKWAALEQQINGGTGYDASKIADNSYFIDVENDMWAGEKSTGDVFAITPDGKYRLVVHSTEGPFENPDSFALEQHGPLGWELNKIYDNTGYGGPPGKLTADTDTMSKTWLKSDGADPVAPAPAASPVSFDPPGTGTQLASTIFGMMDWVPEGKTLLVGKDDNGDKFKMTATKDSYTGNKVISISLFDPTTGTFKSTAWIANEQEYKHWDVDNIKWDAISELPDKSALDDFMGNPNSPATPAAPSAPTAPLLPLTSNNVDAIWDQVQALDVGTVIGTTISGSGNERRLLVGLTGSGVKTITVQQKNSSSDWKKWNDVSKIGLKHELNAYIWTSEIHGTPTPPPSPSFVGKKLSGEDDAQNLWDAAQTLPDGTVLATGKNSSDINMRMVAKTHTDGSHYIEVQKDYDDNGSWQHAWNNNGPFAVHDDLVDDEFYSALDPGVPDTSASPSATTVPTTTLSDMTGTALNAPIGSSSYWAKLTSVKDNIPGGTIVAVHKQSGSTLVKTYDGSWAVEDADGTQIGMNLLYPQDAWNVVPGDWHTPNTAQTMPSAATVAPTAPNVSTPPAPKLMPINKAADVKFHLKNSGNLGYYSKPENIWAAIKEWQSKPGNEQYSPMDIFKSLDNTLKTAKPNPFQEKMTKWAASKKGAQIIGQDGIYGPPQATTPAAPAAPSVPEFKADNVAEIWAHIQNLPVGTVIANGTNTWNDEHQMVVKGVTGVHYIEVQAKDFEDNWVYSHSATVAASLDTELSSTYWKYTATPDFAKPKSSAAPKAVLPDIEAGNDISGFDEAKQKSIYDKVKSEPYTYLSSPEHAVFDAFQSVAKAEGLTLGQVINIVDEYGAKKVSKPNAGLFKQKLAAWVKTPAAAAHILNEPEVVTGLATPPAYHPQYDPNLNPGQIPSFEESSKLKYDWVPSSGAATKIWSDITAKTSDFSAAEKNALTVWTGGAYNTINGHLIKPNPSPLSSSYKTAMKGSQQGMRPSDRPMLLVRGTGFSGLGNAKNHAQLEKMVGTTWRNNGFAATSVGRAPNDEPGVHSPAFDSFPLWIEFEAPPGTPMAWVTPFSTVGTSEREMLLGANLHYKILSVEKKMIPGHGMKTIARVRIVPKPEDNS